MVHSAECLEQLRLAKCIASRTPIRWHCTGAFLLSKQNGKLGVQGPHAVVSRSTTNGYGFELALACHAQLRHRLF